VISVPCPKCYLGRPRVLSVRFFAVGGCWGRTRADVWDFMHPALLKRTAFVRDRWFIGSALPASLLFCSSIRRVETAERVHGKTPCFPPAVPRLAGLHALRHLYLPRLVYARHGSAGVGQRGGGGGTPPATNFCSFAPLPAFPSFWLAHIDCAGAFLYRLFYRRLYLVCSRYSLLLRRKFLKHCMRAFCLSYMAATQPFASVRVGRLSCTRFLHAGR